MKKLLACVTVLMVAACGIEADDVEEGGSAATAVSQAALCSCSPAPPMPALPPLMDAQVWMRTNGQQPFPVGTKNITLVVRRDVRDPARFIAAAWDFTVGRGLVYVSGNTATDLGDFEQNILDAANLLRQTQAGSELEKNIIIAPTKIPGPHPIAEALYKTANMANQAAQQ